MANSNVIYAVTEKLRDILIDSFQEDVDLKQLVSGGDIVFENPGEADDKEATKLSLWLYQVTENEHLKNQSEEYKTGNRLKKPPLALNLYYLVTPFGKDIQTNQLLMGRTLQTFHDNANITLIDPDNQVAEKLHIVFCRLSLEELTRIWEALREAYRLSVCYQVRVVQIDSERIDTTARVTQRSGKFGPVPELDT